MLFRSIITPVDDGSGTPSYELTHDYLVPSLREWLTLEQRQTRKGVAELKLADLAATWEKRKENKLLPSLLEWFQIRHRTVRTEWTKSESRMMLVADRYHWTRLGIVGFVTAILISMGIVIEQWLSWREHGQAEDGLIASVKSTDWTLLPKELDKITQFRPGIDLKVRASIEEIGRAHV